MDNSSKSSTRVILEIRQKSDDKKIFLGTVILWENIFYFVVKFFNPVEWLNGGEGYIKAEDRRQIIEIMILDQAKREENLSDDEYDFFFDLIVSRAIELHEMIKEKKPLQIIPRKLICSNKNTRATILPNHCIFGVFMRNTNIPDRFLIATENLSEETKS